MKAIEIENISKRYKLGTISAKSLSPFNKNKDDETTIFRALEDVNITINKGEILGVIGKNGAGKSTLLKILSKITSPTSGTISIHGRVASLLEVGTGFHPELSGRENVFLNGAILGMSKSEIAEKFDEIVEFSGVEKFIDTPVKRYSSGMYVRLAFAIAAHLEPDILIVDEVLAVGDIEFQKRCLGKMGEVAGNGRTILFVSHSMAAVRTLCTRAVVLSDGKVTFDGNVNKAVSHYEDLVRGAGFDEGSELSNDVVRRGLGQVRFSSIKISGTDGVEKYDFNRGEDVIFEFHYSVKEDVDDINALIGFSSETSGDYIGPSFKHLISEKTLKAGTIGSFKMRVPSDQFLPNRYSLYFWLGNSDSGKPYDVVDGIIAPIDIYTNNVIPELGYLPVESIGYSLFKSELVSNTKG